MDNCNTMRGKKNGLEKKMRDQNDNLLDVSGDTVHMISNAAKVFCEPLKEFVNVQSLASTLYYDIEDSPKQKYLFKGCQEMRDASSTNTVFVHGESLCQASSALGCIPTLLLCSTDQGGARTA